MHNTKKATDPKLKREKTKDDLLKNPKEEKLKKSIYTVSTPRDYVQKSSYADIYAQKKTTAKTPKKVPGATPSSTISPMKGLLKSSASSISIDKKTKSEPKIPNSARSLQRKLPFSNVTVNSPVTKRKLDLNNSNLKERPSSKYGKEVLPSKKVSKSEVTKRTKEVEKTTSDVNKEARSVRSIGKSNQDVEKSERQRTKTRTLDEAECKILKPEFDNSNEMLKLAKKLEAKPKAFYVDLEETHRKTKVKSSDEEVSYEDDFESYESDFDSYHSEKSEVSEQSEESEKSEVSEARESDSSENERNETLLESNLKEGKDEEKMLDSGSYDLRDRSAKSKPAVMEHILEDTEEDKRASFTDEGFQEMSSSAASSMKTELERPMFLDFTKSRQNKLKRQVNERLRQRAKDLLPMISLHEMSFSLFEMQPISYDLYMATFGKSNYTQVGVQTFDDGITAEVQTEEIFTSHKWTQNPVEFSKSEITYAKGKTRKYSEKTEDYLAKFTLMVNQKTDCESVSKIFADENYKSDPLRIYFEQKDGAGSDEMLPYEIYKSKLKNNNYNAHRLNKFLKKCENKLGFHLNTNIGSNLTGLIKTSKLPFSKGHISLTPKQINSEKYSFLKHSTIVNIFLCENKSNLIFTEHKNAQGIDLKKSLVCLWDVGVAREPIKVLIAIDNIAIGRFKGNAVGIFVAALEDGSIHLWDLSEEPLCRIDVASTETTKLVESHKKGLSNTESDRQWNSDNANVGYPMPHTPPPLQACAYTNSALNMTDLGLEPVTGLVMTTEVTNLDSNRKLVGQVVSLQRPGLLVIWSIIQEKNTLSTDIGKAYWSKMKLEQFQRIDLSQHLDLPAIDSQNTPKSFNLNSAKRRIALKKIDKNLTAAVSRPKTAVTKFDFDIDRPSSAASLRKKVLPIEINFPQNGIMCYDLKVVVLNDVNCFLVAKNGGEVLCCRKCLGVVKVDRICVASETSAVTSLEISPQNRPQFLAATDVGTVNLCSLIDNRVLLTLDCRNVPPTPDVGRIQSDHKGRYLGTVASKSTDRQTNNEYKVSIKSVHWCRVNPCCLNIHMRSGAMLTFDLTRSDINASHAASDVATSCSVSDDTLAILTPDGEVQIHRLGDDQNTIDYDKIYDKYVALL